MEMSPAFELVAGSVGAGDFERGGGNVGGVNLGRGQLFGKGKSDAARTGADIHDPRKRGGLQGRPGVLSRLTNEAQHTFNDALGFRPRDEHGRSNDEVHAPEFLVPGDVLRRYTLGALDEGLLVAGLFSAREFTLGVGVKISAVAAEREHQQQFGIHARRRNMCGAEAVDGGGERVAKKDRAFNRRGLRGHRDNLAQYRELFGTAWQNLTAGPVDRAQKELTVVLEAGRIRLHCKTLS